MFGFSKKKQGTEIEFHIKGMHCSACSMNIDGTLEDLDGVIEASTSYAKGVARVTYDPTKIQPSQRKEAIEKLEYTVAD